MASSVWSDSRAASAFLTSASKPDALALCVPAVFGEVTLFVCDKREVEGKKAATRRQIPSRFIASPAPLLFALLFGVQFFDDGAFAITVGFALFPVVDGGQGNMRFGEIGRFRNERLQVGAGLIHLAER